MISKIFNEYLTKIILRRKDMQLTIIKTSAFIFIFALLFTEISFTQDKGNAQDSQKMNEHMKMDKNQMNMNNDPVFDLKAIDKNNDGKVYQCPMDVDVLSDKPGKDPKCGMELEEVSIEKAADNLVKHGYKVKVKTEENTVIRKGTIDLNEIDENKDGKVYEDMMDYNVISDAPGTCPLCGMTLKEVSVEKAKLNLMKNGFKVK
jgi:hypothetical protein